jgi:hypothetical protein
MELKFSFLAYPASYTGGVRVATGDVNLDGLPDVVTVPGRYFKPVIKVFNGSPQTGHAGAELVGQRIVATATYGTKFRNGLSVAVGDVNGDGAADIVTVPTVGMPQVKVFRNQLPDKTAWLRSRKFNAFASNPNFRGGATVTVADLDGLRDGNSRGNIIVGSGTGIRAQVRVFDVTAPAAVYPPIRKIMDPDRNFRFGFWVTAGDVDGDQLPEIITGSGPQGNSFVRVYAGLPAGGNAPLRSFQAFPRPVKMTTATHVLARDIDGDGRAEILAAEGPHRPVSYEVRRFEPLTGKLIDSIFARHPDFSGGGMFLG